MPSWEPDPRNRPQCNAYHSKADILLFGGKPFGSKTNTILGIARYEHKNSLIIRRTFSELESGAIEQSKGFYGDTKNYTAAPKYRWDVDNRIIKFGYGEKGKDFKQYKGPDWDFIGIDEASEIKRFDDGSTAIDLLLPWNRTTIQNQSVRMVLGTNPGGEGEEWIIEYFAPWLDNTYPEPAEQGELRWIERTSDDRLVFHKEKRDDLHSVTFIESSWKDNPYASDDYENTLRLLPIELQQPLLHGIWGASAGDDPYQCIPSAWIKAAQGRWTPRATLNQWTSGGLDVARGGNDSTVLSLLEGNWFAELKKWPGKITHDGKTAAAKVHPYIKDLRFPILCDTFGYGADCYGELKGLGISWISTHFGNEPTEGTDENGKLCFANTRAEAVWRLREALNPDSGDNLELPPDRKILADLSAFKWRICKVRGKPGIQVESKEDIIKRLGRSPDDGDAVIMCYYAKCRDVSSEIANLFGQNQGNLEGKFNVRY